MSKYSIANELIEEGLAKGSVEQIDAAEVVAALIATAIEDYRKRAGSEEARVLLTYELDNLGGTLDMVNLRAR